MPPAFKYNLADILPTITEPSNSDDEIANTKKGRKALKAAEKRNDNCIILDGPISKFINKHHNLVKRYLVLNRCGLFVYKDDLAFRSFP